MNDKQLEKFIQESNHIEGEDDLPIDIEALKKFLYNPLTIESLHEYHIAVTGYKDWSGNRRKIQVWVGNYEPPHPVSLQNLMDLYFMALPTMDGRQSHNEFEKIHPYQDFNGRMGRAIRLHKMQDNYTGELSFLHKYYYQTLSHYEK